MPLSQISSLLALASGLLLVLLVGRLYSTWSRRSRLPPGPKGIPFFGNAFNIPKKHEWLSYKKWSLEYNLIYLNLAGTPMIVLHSVEAANDLFEKRSALYSDRQSGVMVNELIGWDFLVGFMQYGSRWRDSRRAFHQHFTVNAIKEYYPRMTQGSRRLLLRLLDSPEEFMEHLRHMSGELIMRTVYGINVLLKDDPYISISETALQSLGAANAGAFLVDVFPVLKYIPAWFPGAKFQKLAQGWRKDVKAMGDMPFKAVKEALARGDAVASMLSIQLGKLEGTSDNSYQESVFRSAAASAYVGGADTSVSSLGTFILAMLLHPDVQKKAQAEIDRVVGQERLPEFEDEESLPYITAIVKEVLRWKLVTPLAVPHRLVADDEYMGYHLPAGTLVVGNAWAMLHDEKKYSQPDRFFPERYLNEDGSLNPSVPDPAEAVFGFGRRICPGRHLARASVWITVASILAAFDIEKAIDEAGRTIEPIMEYTTGLISYPVPFKCFYKSRTAEAERLIRLCEDEPQSGL